MRKRRLSNGFTLVETIFSLIIFLILFLAISTLIIAVAKKSYTSRNDYHALILAQKRIEAFKAMPEVHTGLNIYEHGDFTIEEDITLIEKYKDRIYRIKVKVYLNEKLLETMESIKINR